MLLPLEASRFIAEAGLSAGLIRHDRLVPEIIDASWAPGPVLREAPIMSRGSIDLLLDVCEASVEDGTATPEGPGSSVVSIRECSDGAEFAQGMPVL